MTYDGDGNPVVASPANPALDQLFLGCRLTLVDPPLQDYAARNPAAFRWGDLQRVFDFTKGDVMIGRGRIESYLGFEKGMTPTEAEIVEEIRNRERWNDPEKNVGFIRFNLWDESVDQFVDGFIYALSGVSLIETTGNPAGLRYLDGRSRMDFVAKKFPYDRMADVESKTLNILLAYFGTEGMNYFDSESGTQSSMHLFTEKPPCGFCSKRALYFLGGGRFPNLIFDFPHWDYGTYPLVWNEERLLYNFKDLDYSTEYLFEYFGLNREDLQDDDTSPLFVWIRSWWPDV